MKKHIGILDNTGVRCIVVFREVPNDEKFCLVVETDRIPDMYHDNLIEMVNSKESQEATDFNTILNRRTFSDGANALQALHYKGYLRKVAVDQVILTPFPGQNLPLELLNAQLKGTLDQYKEKEEKQAETNRAIEAKANPLSSADPKTVALGLLMQVELLETEADKKRNEAFELCPEMIPSSRKRRPTKDEGPKLDEDGNRLRGRPKLTKMERAISNEIKKEKRRLRDRAKAARLRKEKADKVLNEKVDQKILLDAQKSVS